MSITPAQCRAARGLLGWSQSQLAEAAKVSRATIAAFEKGERTPHGNNLDTMMLAMELNGVEFIPQNGGGAGVRFQE